MCKWGTDVEVLVTVPAYMSYTGEDRICLTKIDACISSIVRALNEAGIRTDDSCCGHGEVEGRISLYDGRVLRIEPAQSSLLRTKKDVDGTGNV